MHLAEILGLRPVPGAGVIMMLTRRCPLHCAHCSTASARRGQDAEAAMLVKFAETFGRDGPRVVLLTGGEPLLRPDIASRITAACRRSGASVMVLSGMYFARGGRIPPRITAALEQVDHLSASIDVYHEREVPRRDVFTVLHALRELGKDVSVHVTGSGSADAYLAEVTAAVRAEFGGRVPMLVGHVGAVGRAARWARPAIPVVPPAAALPCAMAAWPVVGVDGRVTACCNQDVVDGRVRPSHLELGDAATDGWPQIRDRLDSPVLRAIRTVGPVRLAPLGDGYCARCHQLDARQAHCGVGLADQVLRLQRRAGAVGFARRYGSADYADLVKLGADPVTPGDDPACAR